MKHNDKLAKRVRHLEDRQRREINALRNEMISMVIAVRTEDPEEIRDAQRSLHARLLSLHEYPSGPGVKTWTYRPRKKDSIAQFTKIAVEPVKDDA